MAMGSMCAVLAIVHISRLAISIKMSLRQAQISRIDNPHIVPLHSYHCNVPYHAHVMYGLDSMVFCVSVPNARFAVRDMKTQLNGNYLRFASSHSHSIRFFFLRSTLFSSNTIFLYILFSQSRKYLGYSLCSRFFPSFNLLSTTQLHWRKVFSILFYLSAYRLFVVGFFFLCHRCRCSFYAFLSCRL